MKGEKFDITGQRFGRLTVLHRVDVDYDGRSKWRVRCDCGCEFDVLAQSLRQGKTRSCGCLRSERMKELCEKRWHETRG